MQNKAFVEDST